MLWTRELGQGYSAFVAQGDRVYTQGQNITGQYLYCLQADTGETIWEYRYGWPYESAGVYPGPRSTPTLHGGRVYFASPDGLLSCVDQDDGDALWSIDLLETYGIEGCDFGYSCSPTQADGQVILPVGGRNAGVVAFDALSGSEVWRSTSERASYTPAYPIDLNGEPLVVCYMQNSLLILDRKTGRLRRKVDLSPGYDEHAAWPIYVEPKLWLSGPFRAGSQVLDLSNLDDSDRDLRTVWRSQLLSNDVSSSVCVDGHIYGFDIFDVQSKTHRPSRGIFRCVDLHTGEEKWSVGTGRPRRRNNADDFAEDIGQCGIIAADGKLIILNELGELILLEAEPQQCIELGRCTILGGELCWTAPCLHRGRLYARNHSRAVCVYLGDPANLPDTPTISISDLPQREYHNLAAMVLAVEPEYAFDIPHDRWLIEWYCAGVGLLILGKLLVLRLSRTGRFADRSPSVEFVILVVLGAIGTTAFGRLTGEFIFTWPVCLFAALEYVAQSRTSQPDRVSVWGFIGRRVPLIAFLATSLLYFFACRRLSLVFEWAFLIGFPAAVPVVWLTNRIPGLTPTRTAGRCAASMIGFSCFYAGAVLFLKARY